MNNMDLLDQFDNLIKSIQSTQTLLKMIGDMNSFVDSFGPEKDAIIKSLIDHPIFESDHYTNEYRGASMVFFVTKRVEILKTIDQFNSRMLSYPSQTIFVQLTYLQRYLESFSYVGLDNQQDALPQNIFPSFKKNIENLAGIYDKFLKRNATYWDLASLGKQVYQNIQDINYFYLLLRRILRKKDSPIDNINQKRISLHLESELNLQQLALKALAIQAVYTELCHIANISPEQNPLTILQLESGSLLSELSGIPKIIDLMEKLITGAISFLHRSFTRDGKISQIPRSVEKIEFILHLRNELKDAGFETVGLDEQINKSSVIIAKNLNVLLLKEAKVVVNRKEYSLSKEQTQKYIEESKKLALPPPKIDAEWEEEQQ